MSPILKPLVEGATRMGLHLHFLGAAANDRSCRLALLVTRQLEGFREKLGSV